MMTCMPQKSRDVRKSTKNSNTSVLSTLHKTLTDAELATFRTRLCESHQRGKCLNSDSCPHSHCLTWQRRNPYAIIYCPKLCPEIEFVKKSSKMWLIRRCNRGRFCNHAHSKEEELYHPLMYKTKTCSSYPNCSRFFCPFAHTLEELRVPAKNDMRAIWHELLISQSSMLTSDSTWKKPLLPTHPTYSTQSNSFNISNSINTDPLVFSNMERDKRTNEDIKENLNDNEPARLESISLQFPLALPSQTSDCDNTELLVSQRSPPLMFQNWKEAASMHENDTNLTTASEGSASVGNASNITISHQARNIDEMPLQNRLLFQTPTSNVSPHVSALQVNCGDDLNSMPECQELQLTKFDQYASLQNDSTTTYPSLLEQKACDSEKAINSCLTYNNFLNTDFLSSQKIEFDYNKVNALYENETETHGLDSKINDLDLKKNIAVGNTNQSKNLMQFQNVSTNYLELPGQKMNLPNENGAGSHSAFGVDITQALRSTSKNIKSTVTQKVDADDDSNTKSQKNNTSPPSDAETQVKEAVCQVFKNADQNNCRNLQAILDIALLLAKKVNLQTESKTAAPAKEQILQKLDGIKFDLLEDFETSFSFSTSDQEESWESLSFSREAGVEGFGSQSDPSAGTVEEDTATTVFYSSKVNNFQYKAQDCVSCIPLENGLTRNNVYFDKTVVADLLSNDKVIGKDKNAASNMKSAVVSSPLIQTQLSVSPSEGLQMDPISKRDCTSMCQTKKGVMPISYIGNSKFTTEKRCLPAQKYLAASKMIGLPNDEYDQIWADITMEINL